MPVNDFGSLAAGSAHGGLHAMNDAAARSEGDAGKGAWIELVQDGRALTTALIIGGVSLHATQILVIAIIMPTIVKEIGGAAFYTWPAMLYMTGAIVGAMSTGAVWARIGARRGYTLGAGLFALMTVVCAMAPDMATLIVARGIQGWAGGLVAGGGTALITSLYSARLRTRILALWQGAFSACHLAGPVVGGAFAAIDWWRGSFWLMVPFMLAFATLAWFRLPDRLDTEAERSGVPPFPFFRLGMLALGVFAIAASGPIADPWLRALLIGSAIGIVVLAFRLDTRSSNKLFPTGTTSIASPVGLALMILGLHAACQSSVTIFLPLLLQVVHSVSPLLINGVTILISVGWTVGSFSVAGWTGARERLALWCGPLISLGALIVVASFARADALPLLAFAAFFMGIGVGAFNVHLVARTMEAAPSGEQRTTAAALASIRSLGTAFGAAFGGVIAHAAGLGAATGADEVGRAVEAVYWASCIPLALAALAMARFMLKARAPAGK
jgi:MFS family permease